MKTLLYASLAVLLLCAICFSFLTYVIGLGIDVSGPATVTLLATFPALHQLFDKSLRRKKKGKEGPSLSTLPEGIVKLEGFVLPWHQAGVYGGLVFAAVVQVVALSLGAFGALFGFSRQEHIVLVVATPFLAGIIMFSVGRWIGIRCGRRGWVAVVVASFLGRVVALLVDMAVSRDAMESFLGGKLTFVLVLGIVVGGGLMLSVVGLAGYWFGRRDRLPKYLQYLLSRLEPAVQRTIVDLAYEEAKRLSKA